MTFHFKIRKNVMLEMRDGVSLCADIFLPDDSAKHPAILIRSYGKERVSARFTMIYPLLSAGYVVVNSDLRGRGKSGGHWDPSQNPYVEGRDGYDSVEWIAAQSWCDGNVGMAGLSHMGSFQWYTAIEQPPHLRAIAPWTTDFNTMYVPPRTGGVISFLTTMIWLPNELKDRLDRLEKAGQDVTEMRRWLQWSRDNPQDFYSFLPLNEVPLARFESINEILKWRLHPLPQTELEKLRRYERIMVPCFHACGWFDGVGWVTFENFNAMRQKGGSESSRNGQYIVAGPWPHTEDFQAGLGDFYFGVQADSAGSKIYQSQIDFFDKYLRGKDIDIPCVRYFLMGENRWHTSETWPPAQVKWQRFYFHSEGKSNTCNGNGTLTRDQPHDEPPDIFDYDPLYPVPTLGGALIGALSVPGIVAGPIDQHSVEKRFDVLCYTTPELTEEMEITGPLQVHLFASTSVVDTDFTAKLCLVYQDGRSFNLADGIIRARGRHLNKTPDFVKPGEINEYIITLGNTSQLFRQGQRIRIQISSSNFPAFDRNMNTGHAIGEDAIGSTARQTVYHQSEFASFIDLPVITKK
ncbi:MAG TPA: CocE/NonD family hydrolase [Dehalococcoidales bacterium]|nr:CocE/NonD family hydrolase [Dehalococcoidales bacterium]